MILLVSTNKTYDSATEGMTNLLDRMLDLYEDNKTDLDNFAKVYTKKLMGDLQQQINAIRSTASDPVANDYFIDKLNLIDDKIFADFPYGPSIKDAILEARKVFRIAVGKNYQKEREIQNKAIIELSKAVGMRQKNVIYDPKRKEEIIKYDDSEA